MPNVTVHSFSYRASPLFALAIIAVGSVAAQPPFSALPALSDTNSTSAPTASANGRPSTLTWLSGSLGTNSAILNANVRSWGRFALHLEGTQGRSFILMASTNLADWAPIQTNLNWGATFRF